MLADRPAKSLLRTLQRRKLATWEHVDEDADVLMITNTWPHPERPANGTFVKYTIDGLRERGVRCDVLLIRGYRGLRAYLLCCLAMSLMSLSKRYRYRLIHSHGGETALVARFFIGAPVLASYLGSDILGPQQGSTRERIKCWLRSTILHHHARLMTVTTTKSTEMAECLPHSVRERNWVIPDGVDRTRFYPIARETARRQVGWPSEEITVISVGNHVALKRLWLAEQATALAAHELPAIRWRSISNVPPAEMPFLYNAADCLTHTSASEGSPNAVKEALACDLPVVATPAGDIAELLAGVTPSAVCAPKPEILADALVGCLKTLHRSNGRERTPHLDVKETTTQTLRCYASLGLHIGAAQASPKS
jgi:glycosyltransferase involved in cell wall biosynthesis